MHCVSCEVRTGFLNTVLFTKVMLEMVECILENRGLKPGEWNKRLEWKLKPMKR
jgi:hypothetical protein